MIFAMSKSLLFGAATLYLVSLFSPAIVVEWDVSPVKFGLELFATGWIGPLAGIVAWYANPLALFAWAKALAKNYKTSAISSIGAFVLGLQTLFIGQFPLGDVSAQVAYLGVGFYLWEGSFLLIVLYSLTQLRAKRTVK